jgi:negative regulator of genetic competence, sporulation and motility
MTPDEKILEAMAAWVAKGNAEEEFANLMYDAECSDDVTLRGRARIKIRQLPHGLDIIKDMGKVK